MHLSEVKERLGVLGQCFFFFFFLLPFGLDGEIKSSVLHASALHTLANLRKTSLVYAEMISRMKGRLPVFQDTG